MNQAFSLDGKVAIVSGASRGIGWAIARQLAESGAHVVLNARDQAALDQRAEGLVSAGLKASAMAYDATDEAAVARAVEDIVAQFGHLDIAIANAGTAHRQALGDHSTADFQRIVDVNLTSPFVLAREASRAMIRQGSGRIIFVASMMGQIARPGVAAYVASKGGVASLAKALAVELGEHGITCNAICPGFTRTDLTQPLQENTEFNAWVEASTPLRRWAEPEEVAAAAVFLASDAASFVTGHLLNVDGGFVVDA